MFACLQSDFDIVVMRRATYDVGRAVGATNPYPWLETYVVSRSLECPPDPAVKVLASVPDVVRLKRTAEGKRVWLCGGGSLAGQALESGLIDAVIIKRNPVVFGEGIPLFEAKSAFRFAPVKR